MNYCRCVSIFTHSTKTMRNYVLHRRVDTHFNGIEKMGQLIISVINGYYKHSVFNPVRICSVLAVSNLSLNYNN